MPQGARGRVVAHGGWIAWVFDEVLGLLPEAHGEWAVTSELAVRYLKPVPVGAEIEAEAWLESSEGRTRIVHGRIRLADTDIELATARGTWVVLDDPQRHYERAQEWARQLAGL